MRRSRRAKVARGAVLAVVAAGMLSAGLVAVRHATAPTTAPGCQATVDGTTVELSATQMAGAATITGIAVRRGLPARAATIGIATAMQESKLVNVGYGDRDSLGLFQQRPSQGWGSRAQVQDPVYATNAFYDVLVTIEGYRSLPITEAAQRVQRSALGAAYAQHEPEARVLASALSGSSPAALTCVLDPQAAPAGTRGVPVLQQALGREHLKVAIARLPGQAGLRLTVPATADPRAPWSLAQWAVGQSGRLGVARVYVDGRVWARSASQPAWTPARGTGVPASGSRQVVVLLSDVAPA